MSSTAGRVVCILSGIEDARRSEPLIRALLDRGHRVVVRLDHCKGGLPADSAATLDSIREHHPRFAYRELPQRGDLWRLAAGATERGLDYLLAADREHADSGPLREGAPRALRVILVVPPFRWGTGYAALIEALRRLRAAIPLPRATEARLHEDAPDVVVAASAVEPGSAQSAYIRAAEAESIPSLRLVAAEAESVELVERAASTPVLSSAEGGLLRALLWLLTPLLAVAMVVLEPHATKRALRKRLRRARKRARRSGRRLRRRRAQKTRRRRAGGTGKRRRPVRARLRKFARRAVPTLRRRWKYTRRAVRGIYNRRSRFTYSRTITRIPSRDELPALLNSRRLHGRGAEIGVKRGAFSDFLLRNWECRELISVDPWLAADPDEYVDRSNVSQEEFERLYEETRVRLARYGTRSSIWRLTSVEAASRVTDREPRLRLYRRAS